MRAKNSRQTNKIKNQLTGKCGTISEVSRDYKEKKSRLVVFGDVNYGEGSSSEHSVLESRHLGGRAIIVKSFARIHETSLKKQGMLPLTFVNQADYDKVRHDDRVSIVGLNTFFPDKNLKRVLKHSDGSKDEIGLQHTFNEHQVG